jgi:hypothetical protein
MIRYKQTQSKSNQDSIVYALEEFDKPVSSNDVKLYLDQKALQNATLVANQKYSNSEISSKQIPEYIHKNNNSFE